MSVTLDIPGAQPKGSSIALPSHVSAQNLLDGAPVPEWVHLLPIGTFSGVDGRGPYTVPDPAAVIAASMAVRRLPVDENHATDLAAPKGEPSPARGWIVEMQ
jgi:phage I-like protein